MLIQTEPAGQLSGALSHLHSKRLHLGINVVLNQYRPQACNQIPVQLDSEDGTPYCAEGQPGVSLKEKAAAVFLPIAVDSDDFTGAAEQLLCTLDPPQGEKMAWRDPFAKPICDTVV